jgi:protein-disulfide isomerase
VKTSFEAPILAQKIIKRLRTALLILIILTSFALIGGQAAFAQSTNASDPRNIILNVGNQTSKGDKNAKLILIEFADYQCPFCGRHFRETEPQIERDYVKTGKVKFIFWDFPLKSHKNAFKAAETARCAHDQGKYWELHDRLFANQESLSLQDLSRHAQAIGLDLRTFQVCLDSGKHEAEVRKDMDEAVKVGVKLTPTFFLGLTEPDNPKVKIEKTILGAKPYTAFKETIDGFLSAQR